MLLVEMTALGEFHRQPLNVHLQQLQMNAAGGDGEGGGDDGDGRSE